MGTREDIIKSADADNKNPQVAVDFKDAPVAAVAQNFYNQILIAIKNELTRPEYANLSIEQIVEKINAPYSEDRVNEIQHESRYDEIVAAINQNAGETISEFTIDESDTITVPTESFEEKLKRLLQEELVNDPMQRGYAEKTPKEKKLLLKEPYIELITATEQMGTRASLILNGIPYAPNVITAQDVLNAQNYTG